MNQQPHPYQPSAAPNVTHSALFDVKAARKARPVVPLTEAPSPIHAAGTRRSWLVAAIAVSAIIGSLAGIGMFSLYQRGQASGVASPQVATSADAGTPRPMTASEIAEPLTDSDVSGDTTASAMRENDAADENRAKTSANERAVPRIVEASGETGTASRADRRAGEPAVKAAAKIDAVKANKVDAVKTEPAMARANVGVASARTSVENRSAANAPRTAPPAAVPERTAAAGRERRATTRRNETSATERDDAPSRSARPGYVDAVRRAIGDRPMRRGGRAGATSGGSVREIFEGQPPRR